MTTAYVLARAQPNGRWIAGIDGNAARRIHRFAIEDWGPGDTGIFGFPNATGTNGHVPGAFVLWVNGYIGDASGHKGRADTTHLESFKVFGIPGGCFFIFLCLSGKCDGKGQEPDENTFHEGFYF